MCEQQLIPSSEVCGFEGSPGQSEKTVGVLLLILVSAKDLQRNASLQHCGGLCILCEGSKRAAFVEKQVGESGRICLKYKPLVMFRLLHF